MFQESFKSVKCVFNRVQGCLKAVQWVFKGSLKGVSRMFPGSFMGVFKKIEGCSERP